MAKLLVNDPAVTALLARNPFADGQPPTRVRARLYPYAFAPPNSAEARAGQHWVPQYAHDLRARVAQRVAVIAHVSHEVHKHLPNFHLC